MCKPLHNHLETLVSGGKITDSSVKDWSSITFAGEKHTLTMTFPDIDTLLDFTSEVQKVDINLPGRLVCDVSITEINNLTLVLDVLVLNE